MVHPQSRVVVHTVGAQFTLEHLFIAHQNERQVRMFRQGLQRSGDHDRSAVVPAHAVQGNGKAQALLPFGV
jgi:hypothetical protein